MLEDRICVRWTKKIAYTYVVRRRCSAECRPQPSTWSSCRQTAFPRFMRLSECMASQCRKRMCCPPMQPTNRWTRLQALLSCNSLQHRHTTSFGWQQRKLASQKKMQAIPTADGYPYIVCGIWSKTWLVFWPWRTHGEASNLFAHASRLHQVGLAWLPGEYFLYACFPAESSHGDNSSCRFSFFSIELGS